MMTLHNQVRPRSSLYYVFFSSSSTLISCWWLEVQIRKVTQYQCRTEGHFKKQCDHCSSFSEKWNRAKWNLWPAEERLERGSWPSQLVLALPSWLGEHLLIISTKSEIEASKVSQPSILSTKPRAKKGLTQHLWTAVFLRFVLHIFYTTTNTYPNAKLLSWAIN